MHALEEMTQAKWSGLTPAERDKIRSSAGLTAQLVGLEGWRVEVERLDGSIARFIVGRSSGWVPCHIEIKTAVSTGGFPADRKYRSVRALKKAR